MRSSAPPSSFLFFFFSHKASSKLHTSNIFLRDASALEQAAAVPLSHSAPKLCVTDAEGCVRALTASLQCSGKKLPEMDQHSSQKLTVPSLGLEIPFSCFGDKFWAQGTSLLGSQALRWKAECSMPWPGCDISQPVLGCVIETHPLFISPHSSAQLPSCFVLY